MYSFERVSASVSTLRVAVEAQLSAPRCQVQSECKGRDVIPGRHLQRLGTWSRMSWLPLQWLSYGLSISCLYVLLDSDASVVQGRDDWVAVRLFRCVSVARTFCSSSQSWPAPRADIPLHAALPRLPLGVCPSAQMQLYCFSFSSLDCPRASSPLQLQRKNGLAKVLGHSLVKNNAFY